MGHALNTWLNDYFNLPKQLVEAIIFLGGPRLKSFLESVDECSSIYKGFFPTNIDKMRSFRKLSYFADKEGKTRVIAICDYLSQTVLRNLHLYLFRVLKKIPQDCTFDQGKFVEQIQEWKVFYSVDLSSATDRFPIQIIETVLRGHLPPDYVAAWKTIMVGFPFDYLSPNRDLQSVSYAVGNPMGAYSSWASFAVAHHFIIFTLCKELGIPFKDAKYFLLGDDVIIGDSRLGDAYLAQIRSLGVDVSFAKTHISTTTLEFAKR